MRCHSVCLSLERWQLGAVGKWGDWVTAGYQSWQFYAVPVVCQWTALLCSNAASANDMAVPLSVMNCGWFMGPCRTSHHPFFLHMLCWWRNQFQGIKHFWIIAVSFHFCLCISGDHLVGKGINHAEGSITEGNPLLPGLFYLFFLIVKPVNVLLLPVGHGLLKAISLLLLLETGKQQGLGFFFPPQMMVLHCKLLIKPYSWGKQNKREDTPSENKVVL